MTLLPENTSMSRSSTQLTFIKAGQKDRDYWRDLWRYRELFQMLAWRDISVRYKQTVIGVAWAVIRPLLTMIIFTVIFGRVAKLPTEGSAPYALLVLAGMLPWQFFSTALADASGSLVSNANLVTKIYFPRSIMPASALMVSLVDLGISMSIAVVLMLWFGHAPGWSLVMFPAYLLAAVVAGLGPSLWLSALTVKYRDFRYVVPFMVQFGLYVSPVGFSSAVIPEAWRPLFYLNPMAAVIDGFRWSLLGDTTLYWPGQLIGTAVSFVLLYTGQRYFRAVERGFADVI